MKFRWKLMIVTMLIVSFSFGFGGMLLIQYSYEASIKQEKKPARGSYEMILRMLKEIDEMDDTYQNQTFVSVLKRLNRQRLLRDSSVRLLKEEDGVVQWKQPLYYNRKNDNFRNSSGFSSKQGKAVIFKNKNKVFYQITSKITYGKETMVFQGSYDISEVYETRHQQLISFRKIFMVVIGMEIILSYFLASILTRPLQKLSQVSKQIADGDYSVRVSVNTKDEIGELSINFNYMTEQLVEKLMKLDQLLKNQEEFMGSLAHELKTPMTSILGYADTLLTVRLQRQQQERALSYISSECRRLSRLSVKMLELTGLYETGEARFAPTENSVKSFLEDSRQLNLCRLKEKNICLELQCEPADLKKNFDKDLLLSLVNNFIDNAVKASADNSKLILAATAGKLMVQDFGKGIPAEDLDKVTEAFYMVDKSRSRANGSVGLGLALCKKIADIHGFQLKIESEIGKGTCVFIEW